MRVGQEIQTDACKIDLQAISRPPHSRWFIRYGSTTHWDKGFQSKQLASDWIESHCGTLDWRVGFIFRIKGDNKDVQIVDSWGKRAKP